MNLKNIIFLSLIFINIILVLNLFIINFTKNEAEKDSLMKQSPDLMPTIIFYNDNSADVLFTKPKNYNNYKDEEDFDIIYPKTEKYRIKKENVQKCLNVMKKNYKTPNKENKKLIDSIPGYVSYFGEYTQNYDFDKIDWDGDFKDDYEKSNPFHILGFYEKKLTRDMYDDDPELEPNFENAHMGIFNDKNYCVNHDLLLLQNYLNDKNYIKKNDFVSDYHQMSLLRLFSLNNYGKDRMIEMSKNMDRVNYYQKLYSIDLRTDTFITKKSGWHFYHEIGKNFNCFGQSYNHIPGHGNLIRKDLLTMASNEYINKFENHKKCKEESNIFPLGYRLYKKDECIEFFNIINNKEYYRKKVNISIQFVIKLGYGVHRGQGVFIFDIDKEKEIREQYENGKKCGQIELNQIAQEYIHDPLLLDDHKFDLRIYMFIASVDPLIIYYHDGFLRVSINKYDIKSNKRDVHLTNTEIFKAILKDIREKNQLYNGMGEEELREFQMRTMDQFYDYLLKKKIVDNIQYAKNKIKDQLKKSFLHLGKMVENNLFKNPNNFELFGVDFILDKKLNVYVLEVNPSPMLIGTADRKTQLMKKLMKGMFDIAFKLKENRTKKGLEFVIKNKLKIDNLENIRELKKEFKQEIKNDLEGINMENNPWEICYDGSKEGNEKYLNFVSEECIELIEKSN